MTQQDKIIKLATGVMGWEALTVGYWGHGNMERGSASPRQYELEEWIGKVGLTDVGDYFLHPPSDFWIEQGDWNPFERWDHAGMVVEKLKMLSSGVFELRLTWIDPETSPLIKEAAESNQWMASFLMRGMPSGTGSEPLVAICEAALATQGD